jgi:hypothetical protein
MTTTGTRHGSAMVTLPSDREILITRAFDAPAALVAPNWSSTRSVTTDARRVCSSSSNDLVARIAGPVRKRGRSAPAGAGA